jgi:AcrR family transcriptional regulator
MKPKIAEKSDSTQPKRQHESTRERVLEAAFTLFCEQGFSDVSMLEVATRAQVSKRDLYALFRNKQAVLADWIKRVEKVGLGVKILIEQGRTHRFLCHLLFKTVRNSQQTAAISSEFKFRHNVNTLALPNSPAVRPSYR